jgi:hypothetical protein
MRRAQQQAGIRNQESGDKNQNLPRFMPALGGPMPQASPRTARPADMPNDTQAQLQNHQADRMDQLSEAGQSLRSDEQSLQRMREQLEQAMRRGQEQGEQPGSQQGQQPQNQQSQQGQQGEQQGNQQSAHNSEGDRQLAEMLQSPGMQRAMQMADRLRQMRGQEGQPGQPQQSMSHATTPNSHGQTAPAAPEAELAKLDPATRNLILKMQPQLREELLQGMRDAGPEGYQKFIEDYFKRLSEVKK